MTSLQHVCIWSDNGWKHITASEAAKIHPGGTVSAHSGLFMCELCGQYVHLIQGEYQVPHFRHSSSEKNKDCSERTFGSSYYSSYRAVDYDLPIRIIGIKSDSFQFELGLIKVPDNLSANDFCITIKPVGYNVSTFVYSKERLNADGITYLSIGDIPYTEYTLSYPETNNDLSSYWPKKVNGVDLNGTLFEKNSGRKLPYDADVEVNKEYYLLTNRVLFGTFSGIKIKEICLKRVYGNAFYLYLVSADELNENAAKFFLRYHYRLTSEPVSMQTIWPPYVQGSYLIKYNQKSIYMLLKGNVEDIKTFPTANSHHFLIDDFNKLYNISCSERQQLISTGRSNVLQYAYFWKEPIDSEVFEPEFSVTDIDENYINDGECTDLPKNKIIRIYTAYDGEAIIIKGGIVFDKIRISAQKEINLDGISYGVQVRLLIGLDCIWDCKFVKDGIENVIVNEEEILKYIQGNGGSMLVLPHSLFNMAVELKHYPKIHQWVLKCVRDGKISEQSFRRLQRIYRKIKNNQMIGV